MTSFIETASTIIILIIAIVFLSHLINGTGSSWIASKFKVSG